MCKGPEAGPKNKKVRKNTRVAGVERGSGQRIYVGNKAGETGTAAETVLRVYILS